MRLVKPGVNIWIEREVLEGLTNLISVEAPTPSAVISQLIDTNLIQAEQINSLRAKLRNAIAFGNTTHL